MFVRMAKNFRHDRPLLYAALFLGHWSRARESNAYATIHGEYFIQHMLV